MAGLLQDVMAAHGGLERWRDAQRVRAVLSTGGALFTTRRVVLPRTSGGGVRPFPKLVWIDVHEAALET